MAATVSQVTPGSTAVPSARPAAAGHSPTSTDTVGTSTPDDPIQKVRTLIADLRSGTIHYAPEIAAGIRPEELTLKNFPCHKYILDGSQPVDASALPAEIVPHDGTPSHEGTVTVESKHDAKAMKKDLKTRVKSIRDQLRELARQGTESVLVVGEGDNAAGKDSTLDNVFNVTPTTTIGAHAFKAPEGEEAEHPLGWRDMQFLPGPGQVAFLNRSAYGDVAFAAKTEAEKRQRTAEIMEMEYGLTMGLPMTSDGHIALPIDDQGHVSPDAMQRPPMRIIKVLLNVSSAEQAKKLLERLDPAEDKADKASLADIQGHGHHAEIMQSFAEPMALTSTPWAPTYVLPNDNKDTGRRKMAQISDEVLHDMAPQRGSFEPELTPAVRQKAAATLQAEVDAARPHAHKD